MVQGWVGLCGEFETWQRGCRRDGTEQVETRCRLPATRDGAARCQGDELKPLDEEVKRLYQRIVAKTPLSCARPAGSEVCNFLSSKCCLVA